MEKDNGLVNDEHAAKDGQAEQGIGEVDGQDYDDDDDENVFLMTVRYYSNREEDDEVVRAKEKMGQHKSRRKAVDDFDDDTPLNDSDPLLNMPRHGGKNSGREQDENEGVPRADSDDDDENRV